MIDLRFSEAELARRREHIGSFLQEQVAAAGAEGAVIGLSGGIDSATAASLAVEALGANAVRALVLPGTVSTDQNMSHAELVAEELGIAYDLVPIGGMVDSVLDGFPEISDDKVAIGNARARMRAVCTYLIANHDERLVIGTGNRSEAQVGYFTKYGDGAVDCHPIGNLYKVQVRQLARALGVPEAIVEKPPTAGLWADQTDEEELGLRYETLDPILALHVDGPLSADATARELDVERETVDRVRELHAQSAHKRATPPSPEPLD
ncbi:NAD synthetase [Salinarchaeum sp. Harcht-Bsk1]|uniref:NAD+ synthase n=1 Tax=Salinarchaeum sp. Harcht-Bsk1 TaxID=1333523 RepID=UPI0003424423|nr:NAD+ synthase [Salinarchaeum sp. Harcht-Bsk1]AGN01262.1 NAD synthetase [Salinarchaeum sp. Harcht-Bsk1]